MLCYKGAAFVVVVVVVVLLIINLCAPSSKLQASKLLQAESIVRTYRTTYRRYVRRTDAYVCDVRRTYVRTRAYQAKTGQNVS